MGISRASHGSIARLQIRGRLRTIAIRMDHEMQHQRFECKYLITEGQAMQIREFIKGYLVLDDFSANRPNHCYPVHSVYLDSHDLMTYWATVRCEKRRFKLRVRFYDDNPDSPLFFEIKRRENDCIIKRRGAVHRQAGVALLAGQLPAPEHLISDKPHHLAALQQFCRLKHELNAGPTVHVGYLREAWVSPNSNAVRATIDRSVRGEPRPRPVFSTQMVDPVFPFGNRPILELKFTDRFPNWFKEMVQHFNLTRVGVPKYCGSVAQGSEIEMDGAGPEGGQEKLARAMRYC
jgi:hypothetical protein